MYSPVRISSQYDVPSLYIVSSVSMVFDLLSIVVAISDISLSVLSLRFYWKKSAQQSASSGSESPPSSRFFGYRRTSVERSEFPGEIKKYAFRHTVFRKKEWVTVPLCWSSLTWTTVRFEPTSLAIIRGLLATTILTLLVIYGLDVAIRQPVAERAKGPSTRSGQLLDTPDSSFHLGFLDNMAFIVGVRSKSQMYRNELTLYYDLVPKEFWHESVGHAGWYSRLFCS